MIREAIIRNWPFPGLERIMGRLRLPVPQEETAVTRLRGYPLRMKYQPRSYLGMFLHYRGMYEERVIRKLRELLDDGMTFVDIGANIGLYTVIARHLLPNGRVVAFEPQQSLCKLVEENLALNGMDSGVELHCCALGDSSGEGELFQVSRTNQGQATLKAGSERTFGKDTVRIARPDEVLPERVDGIKIDVEGAELQVLRAMSTRLRERPPAFIFLECIDDHLGRFGDSTQDLIGFLTKHGYETHCLQRGRWHPIRSVDDHARCGHSPDWLARRNPAHRQDIGRPASQ